jgi:hypothetical protein
MPADPRSSSQRRLAARESGSTGFAGSAIPGSASTWKRWRADSGHRHSHFDRDRAFAVGVTAFAYGGLALLRLRFLALRRAPGRVGRDDASAGPMRALVLFDLHGASVFGNRALAARFGTRDRAPRPMNRRKHAQSLDA